MDTPRPAGWAISWSRAALWPGLAIWTIALLRTPLPALGGSFIHLINLVFHEAGHIVFAPLGSFIWEAILAALGWLHLDHTIARAVWTIGAALMVSSLCYAFVALRSQKEL